MIGKLLDKYREGGLPLLWKVASINAISVCSMTADRLYDLRYGIETSSPIHRPKLDIASNNAQFGTSYFPTPWWTFRKIIKSLDINPSQYTFIDYGSGKGRVPLLAGKFKKAIGVEYARQLHEVAVRNAAKFPKQNEVEFVHADAALFPIPPGPCVFYFFNPFDGPVLTRVLDRIVSRQPQPDIAVCMFRQDNDPNLDMFRQRGFRSVKALFVRDQSGKRRTVTILKAATA